MFSHKSVQTTLKQSRTPDLSARGRLNPRYGVHLLVLAVFCALDNSSYQAFMIVQMAIRGITFISTDAIYQRRLKATILAVAINMSVCFTICSHLQTPRLIVCEACIICYQARTTRVRKIRASHDQDDHNIDVVAVYLKTILASTVVIMSSQ